MHTTLTVFRIAVLTAVEFTYGCSRLEAAPHAETPQITPKPESNLIRVAPSAAREPPPTVRNPSRSRAVSRASVGKSWPLKVDEGWLECVGSNAVVFHHAGIAYAVNGAANANSAFTSIAPIWADDPTAKGTKLDLGPLIGRGLARCAT